MLLSEKDSIVFPRALSPELRIMNPRFVHPVPDYTGATKEEREQRIARHHPASAASTATTRCSPATASWPRTPASCAPSRRPASPSSGPCSLHADRGRREGRGEAHRASRSSVSVTPGINDATVRTLLRKHPDRAALARAGEGRTASRCRPARHGACARRSWRTQVLEASYAKRIDLFTIDDLGETLRLEARAPAARAAGPTLPPEGDRRRRRQGPAHLQRRRAGAGPGARGPRRGEGDRRRATTRTCCSS